MFDTVFCYFVGCTFWVFAQGPNAQKITKRGLIRQFQAISSKIKMSIYTSKLINAVKWKFGYKHDTKIS